MAPSLPELEELKQLSPEERIITLKRILARLQKQKFSDKTVIAELRDLLKKAEEELEVLEATQEKARAPTKIEEVIEEARIRQPRKKQELEEIAGEAPAAKERSREEQSAYVNTLARTLSPRELYERINEIRAEARDQGRLTQYHQQQLDTLDHVAHEQEAFYRKEHRDTGELKRLEESIHDLKNQYSARKDRPYKSTA